MKYLLKKSFYLVVASLFLFSACKKWEAPKFEAPVYTGKKAKNHIADIKDRHMQPGINAIDSICDFPGQNFIVKAVVVSSDESGNCYKYLTLQDKTGGIEIAIDKNYLFNDYPVGQIVYLNCDGLVVGDNNGNYQIGWKNQNNLVRINQVMLDSYLSKDGLPSTDNIKALSPCDSIFELVSGNQLNDEMCNCLVILKNARFSSACHNQTLGNADRETDRALSNFNAALCPTQVHTSNYALFRNRVIDTLKTYDLTGILTKYNNGYRLTLRSDEDMKEVHR